MIPTVARILRPASPSPPRASNHAQCHRRPRRVQSLVLSSSVLADDNASFAFVGAALMSLVYLAAWQSMQVGRARKAAGIACPQSMYSFRGFLPFVR
jgi:hypothetical protein